ncbi:MAG: hypothetical protein WDW36_010269 [Sanguina aurantia]
MAIQNPPGVVLLAPVAGEHADIVSPAAQTFLATLHRCFNARRLSLLQKRNDRQRDIDAGIFPDFLKETRAVREDPSWKGANPAPGMIDRRVEITGPVDRKMVINALNSGASTFMADFEDSHAPTWTNNLDGIINLRDALKRTISYSAPNGKFYKLKAGPLATLLVRPRGWHLDEGHMVVDGQVMSASLFDFGLYFFHCAKISVSAGQGPYFYLPKMESHLEARLWNDVFNMSQDLLAIPRGTIRATVLIETILASFEMEEILFELREHSSGLNCGRWDYIFSYIKKFRNHASCVLPDRSDVSMASPFMVRAGRGPVAADAAGVLGRRADKLREVRAGHDGTWVAHPALVPIAQEIFDEHMPAPNQLDVLRSDVSVTRDQLIAPCPGTISREGFENNVEVCLRYTAAWMDGLGCVPIHHLMEDAATAEMARAQLWQWLHHGGLEFPDHAPIDFALFDQLLAAHVHRMGESTFPGASRARAAAALISTLTHADQLGDFLTLPAYEQLA